MTEFAVVRAAGKQFGVSVGDIIQIAGRLEEEKKLAELFEVLLYSSGETILIGRPILENVKIKASLVGSFKGPKIKVQKFKPKVRYRRKKGYRPAITEIKIEKIDLVQKKD